MRTITFGRTLALALTATLALPALASATPYGDALARFLDEASAEEAAERDDVAATDFKALADLARRSGSVRREDLPHVWMDHARNYGGFAHSHAWLLRLEKQLAALHPAVATARPEVVAHATVDLLHARHELSEPLVFVDDSGRYLEHAQADLDSLGGDRDGDGIPDAADACPDQPEDRDGFKDEDGCPDPDNDGDGILDAKDKCPNDAEDKDGFQDDDGCPDPDNDGDGIVDAKDACPNVAETVNGILDDDGCPDLLQPVHFATDSARLDAAAIDVLRDNAVVLSSGLVRVRLEGHADTQDTTAHNRALGMRRAAAVRDYLVNVVGIPADRLETASSGDERPVANNDTDAGRAANRRTEFVIIPGGR